MKCIAVILICIGFIFNTAIGSGPVKSIEPKNGFVPDSATAVTIARTVLTTIYGKEQIISEEPLTASLQGDIWLVVGTLPKGVTKGGVAELKLSKKDGRIISVIHWE